MKIKSFLIAAAIFAVSALGLVASASASQLDGVSIAYEVSISDDLNMFDVGSHLAASFIVPKNFNDETAEPRKSRKSETRVAHVIEKSLAPIQKQKHKTRYNYLL